MKTKVKFHIETDDDVMVATEDIADELFNTLKDDPYFREDIERKKFETVSIFNGEILYKIKHSCSPPKKLSGIFFEKYDRENFILDYFRFYEVLDTLFEHYENYEENSAMGNMIDEPGKYVTNLGQIATVWNIDDETNVCYGTVEGDPVIWNARTGQNHGSGHWRSGPHSIVGKKMGLPTEEENPSGLHKRYHVTKVNGEDDPNAEYFVLRLDGGGDDPAHIAACREALKTYCEEIEDHLPDLEQDLRDRYLKSK